MPTAIIVALVAAVILSGAIIGRTIIRRKHHLVFQREFMLSCKKMMDAIGKEEHGNRDEAAREAWELETEALLKKYERKLPKIVGGIREMQRTKVLILKPKTLDKLRKRNKEN